MEQSVCGDKEKLRGADYRRMGIQAGGFPAEPTPMLENIHREHFGGAHQLMFLLNRTEQEENFFIKKNNHLKKKTGFLYITA